LPALDQELGAQTIHKLQIRLIRPHLVVQRVEVLCARLDNGRIRLLAHAPRRHVQPLHWHLYPSRKTIISSLKTRHQPRRPTSVHFQLDPLEQVVLELVDVRLALAQALLARLLLSEESLRVGTRCVHVAVPGDDELRLVRLVLVGRLLVDDVPDHVVVQAGD